MTLLLHTPIQSVVGDIKVFCIFSTYYILYISMAMYIVHFLKLFFYTCTL